jgi:hypothetical protein
MKPPKIVQLAVAVGIAAVLCGASQAWAQTAPSLGAAQSFAVAAGSTVTNTGPTVVTGDLGLSPGTAVTGFPPGLVIAGTIHAANAVALAAQNSITTAYNALESQPCTQVLTGQDLGGMTLTPGVYCFTSSAQLTGVLTLNALGNPAAVFIFKIGSTLTTASSSSVVMINGGNPCNVFWQVGSSATLGTTTSFIGNILALTSITLTTGANVSGRTLARNGAVTLDSNRVTITCPGPSTCPTISINPPVIPPGQVGVAASVQLVASGGTGPYVFSIVGGTLPAGVTLTPGGLLSGTPTTVGSTTVTIRASDANGCPGTVTYTIVIGPASCPVITISPPVIPPGQVGVPATLQLTASGGTGPYVFAVVAGTLPAGITLSSTGLLSGTPTTAGTSPVSIRATDANSCPALIVYTIVISPAGCPVITLAPPTLPVGQIGVAYSQQITASGGTGPYTFSIVSGSLPVGLTLSASGLVSGTPTTAGSSTVVIQGTDANGCPGRVTYTIVITTGVPTLPQYFVLLLALGLAVIGYLRLRQRGRVA